LKINYTLLLKIIVLEILYSIALFFASLFFLWGYFGEGAGAESPQAILCGKIATGIILLPPLVFNLCKMIKSSEKQNFLTYLIAEIIIVLLYVFAYYKGFIGT
jgi:hypothetical protein